MLHVYVTPQGPLAFSCLETFLTNVFCGKRPFKKLIGLINVLHAHPQEGDPGGQFFRSPESSCVHLVEANGSSAWLTELAVDASGGRDKSH